MRLLKKLLSGALACAIGMMIFTSCGSSGGSTTPATLETSKIGTLLKAGKYYLDYEASYTTEGYNWSVHRIIAASGDYTYVKSGSSEAWTDSEYTYVPAKQYFEWEDAEADNDDILIKIEREPFTIVRQTNHYSYAHTKCGIVPEYDEIKEFSASTVNVNGSSYYGETIEFVDKYNNDVKLTFCYSGNTCKYIIYAEADSSNGSSTELTITANQLTSSFDESIFDLPSQYTQIMTEDDYLTARGV